MSDNSNRTDSQKQEKDTKQKYFHIQQSQGGVYTLPHTYDGTVFSGIGSTGCRTCVCVFVELSKTACFIAHMSAMNFVGKLVANYPDPTAEHVAQDKRGQYIVKGPSAQQLKKFVLKTLRETPGLSNEVRGESFAGKVGRTLVICPQKIFLGEPATGTLIIEALEEFFGVTMNYQRGHGFIASTKDNDWNLQVVGWKDGWPGPSDSATDFYDYEKHDQGSEEYGWIESKDREGLLRGRWAFAGTAGSWGRSGYWS